MTTLGSISVVSLLYEVPLGLFKELLKHAAADHITQAIHLMRDAMQGSNTAPAIRLETLSGETVIPHHSDTSSLAELALRSGADPRLCSVAATLVGEEKVAELLKQNVRIWCQDTRSTLALNSFLVFVRNPTSRRLVWLPKFEIVDHETEMVENRFFRYGLDLNAGEPWVGLFKWGDLLPSPGRKKIVAIDVPRGLEIKPVEIEVLPIKALA